MENIKNLISSVRLVELPETKSTIIEAFNLTMLGIEIAGTPDERIETFGCLIEHPICGFILNKDCTEVLCTQDLLEAWDIDGYDGFSINLERQLKMRWEKSHPDLFVRKSR